MIEECPFSNEQCKYYGRPPIGKLRRTQEHGCFSDNDHIVPQRIAREIGERTLEHIYIYSPENMQQLCRDKHDAKTLAGDEPLPERPQLIESLLRQADDDMLGISRRALKKMIKRDIKRGGQRVLLENPMEEL